MKEQIIEVEYNEEDAIPPDSKELCTWVISVKIV